MQAASANAINGPSSNNPGDGTGDSYTNITGSHHLHTYTHADYINYIYSNFHGARIVPAAVNGGAHVQHFQCTGSC